MNKLLGYSCKSKPDCFWFFSVSAEHPSNAVWRYSTYAVLFFEQPLPLSKTKSHDHQIRKALLAEVSRTWTKTPFHSCNFLIKQGCVSTMASVTHLKRPKTKKNDKSTISTLLLLYSSTMPTRAHSNNTKLSFAAELWWGAVAVFPWKKILLRTAFNENSTLEKIQVDINGRGHHEELPPSPVDPLGVSITEISFKSQK